MTGSDCWKVCAISQGREVQQRVVSRVLCFRQGQYSNMIASHVIRQCFRGSIIKVEAVDVKEGNVVHGAMSGMSRDHVRAFGRGTGSHYFMWNKPRIMTVKQSRVRRKSEKGRMNARMKDFYSGYMCRDHHDSHCSSINYNMHTLTYNIEHIGQLAASIAFTSSWRGRTLSGSPSSGLETPKAAVRDLQCGSSWVGVPATCPVCAQLALASHVGKECQA